MHACMYVYIHELSVWLHKTDYKYLIFFTVFHPVNSVVLEDKKDSREFNFQWFLSTGVFQTLAILYQ